MNRFLLLAVLLAALGACSDSSYQTPARSLNSCFFEPWRPNC